MYGNCDSWSGSSGSEEQRAGVEHPLYNYSFCAMRSARKYGREERRERARGRARDGLRGRVKKEAGKESRRACGERGRVDNSQDRIVPGAKNQSIPGVLSDGRDARGGGGQQVPSHAHPFIWKCLSAGTALSAQPRYTANERAIAVTIMPRNAARNGPFCDATLAFI